VIDLYIADGSEPLWVTSIWLALKFLVVWLALRLTLLRAFLAVVAMVIASTVVLMAWEIVLPTSLPLLALLVLRVAVVVGRYRTLERHRPGLERLHRSC
jgi:glycerol-3-phosphate acyltransferase PlsY